MREEDEFMRGEMGVEEMEKANRELIFRVDTKCTNNNEMGWKINKANIYDFGTAPNIYLSGRFMN